EARDNVKRLLEYYRAYCTRVGNDLLASDEEKIRRRWNVLKSCEQDILIYGGQHSMNKKLLGCAKYSHIFVCVIRRI
ncbi:MAG: hypothetical protein II713_01630, partial [Clostridia bacterium]|nr:hypothetical protein [Clostridia bacterium]